MNTNEEIPIYGAVHPIALEHFLFKSMGKLKSNLHTAIYAIKQLRHSCIDGEISRYPIDRTIRQLSKTAADILAYCARHIPRALFSFERVFQSHYGASIAHLNEVNEHINERLEAIEEYDNEK